MKKKERSVQQMVIAALLIAVGLLLPQIFHMVGGSTLGGIVLPMHLPVFMAGFLLGPVYGVLVGLLTPLVSFLLTGMPPAIKLPFMMIELVTYGLLTGICKRRHYNIFLSIIFSQIGGRLVYAVSLVIGAGLLGLELPLPYSIVGSTLKGLPGILLQLIIIPVLVVAIRRAVPIERKTRRR